MLALVNRTITIYQFVFGVLTTSLQKVGYRTCLDEPISLHSPLVMRAWGVECDHAYCEGGKLVSRDSRLS